MSGNPFESPLEQKQSSNPFVPGISPRQQAYVEGNCLVVLSGARLPERCVKTNAPVNHEDERTKKLYYAPPFVFLLILLNLLIMLIVYFIVRKECMVTFYESSESRGTRRIRVIVGWLVTVLLFLSCVPLAAMDNAGPFALCIIAGFISLIVTAVLSQGPIKVTKHKDGYFWLKGFAPEFLEEVSRGL